MVDMIKLLPPLSKPISSNNHYAESRSSSRQITLPILLSTITINSQHERRIISNYKKQSVRRSPNDINHQTHLSNTSDSRQQKFIDHEMARYYPGTTVDISASIKIKQQQKQLHKYSNKEQFKAVIGSGTAVTSIPILTNVDDQSLRLFDTLSKHFTIKAEPLRPTNNFVYSTTSTLYSWKKYWTSTEIPKQRHSINELYGSVPGVHDSRRDQTLLSTKDSVTNRDSSLYTNSGTFRRSSTSSTRTNISDSIQVSSQITLENHHLPMNEAKSISIPQTVSKNEETSPIDQSELLEQNCLFSGNSNNTITNNDHELLAKINRITTKMYRFPLPSNSSDASKSIVKQTLLKPIEKQSNTRIKSFDQTGRSISSVNTSTLKRKRQKITDRKPSNNKANRPAAKKQQFISTVTPTILKSKYEKSKWDQPYVGTRKDPPAPPCSPLVTVGLRNQDQVEDDTLLKQESSKM